MFTVVKLVLAVALVCTLGYVVHSAIAPVCATIAQTLHNATLDNRGLHD